MRFVTLCLAILAAAMAPFVQTVHAEGVPAQGAWQFPADRATLPRAQVDAILARGGTLHVVQQAFIDEQAAQCGYCINGWIMTAAALLEADPHASEEDIRKGLAGLKCRCGTHMSILRAVKRAAKKMGSGSS